MPIKSFAGVVEARGGWGIWNLGWCGGALGNNGIIPRRSEEISCGLRSFNGSQVHLMGDPIPKFLES